MLDAWSAYDAVRRKSMVPFPLCSLPALASHISAACDWEASASRCGFQDMQWISEALKLRTTSTWCHASQVPPLAQLSVAALASTECTRLIIYQTAISMVESSGMLGTDFWKQVRAWSWLRSTGYFEFVDGGGA